MPVELAKWEGTLRGSRRGTAGAKPYTMKVVRTVCNGGDEETGLCRPRLVATQLGGLHPASGPRRALSGQTEHPEGRAQAPDIADTHQTLGSQDDLIII